MNLAAKSPEDIFPENDRPRGIADIDSVKYHMVTENHTDPIMILCIKNENNGSDKPDKYILLDGVHRLAAAYLLDCPIRYCVYVVKN